MDVMKQRCKKIGESNCQSGFSLIEVAIFMVILGLLITPFLRQYNIQEKQRRIDVTDERLALVRDALSKYVIREGRYPLPSDPNLRIGDSGFGFETTSSINPCAAGNDAVCWTAGNRDTDADVDAANDRVVIGHVPFAELQLLQKFIVDGYYGRITYAVSEYMTDPVRAPVEEDWGVIDIRSVAAGAPNALNNHFVLVSHGEDGKGTRSSGGAIVLNCGAGHVDDENCDNDALFTDNLDIVEFEGGDPSLPVYARAQSLVQGSSYYDDYLKFTSSFSGGDWSFDPGSNDIRSASQGNILIGEPLGLANFLPDTRIVIADGDLEATDLFVNRLCDFDDTDPTAQCDDIHPFDPLDLPPSGVNLPENFFTPSVITGSVDQLDYGADGGGIRCREFTVGGNVYSEPMRGIAQADEQCGLTSLGTLTVPSCPPPQQLRGIDASGGAICELP